MCTGSIAQNGAVTYTVGGAGTVACPQGSSTTALTVSTVSTGTFSIPPFFFINNYQVRGNGVYQCELA